MSFFADRLAVVTGAGSGIGRALALNLAAQGAKLVLCDVNKKTLEETAQSLGKNPPKTSLHIIDTSDRDAVHALADKVRKDMGGADLVINNAGVAQAARVEDLTYDDLHWVMDVNFWGMVHGTKAFLPHLLEKNKGHIANISSVFGLYSVPGQAAYNASKFAIRGFTDALRHELRDTPIAVSSVFPGGIKTNIAKNMRLPQDQDTPEERDRIAAQFEEFTRTTPERAAEIILKGMQKEKPRIRVGGDAVLMDLVQRLFPNHYGRILFRRMGAESEGLFGKNGKDAS